MQVTVNPAGAIRAGAPTPAGSSGFLAVPVRGILHGRASVTIGCSDGSITTANYFVMPPLDSHVASYAAFNARVAWYANETDPFGRGSSVLAYNRLLRKHIGVGPWDGGYEDNRIFVRAAAFHTTRARNKERRETAGVGRVLR